MGRMINIFDLSVGMSGNRLITDRPHRDGSPVRRNYSDAPKEMLDPVGNHVEDKSTVKEPRRGSPNKKSSGTPMKMLIAQEMSKDTEPKRKPHNVVARLMGLDTLPAQQPSRTAQRSFPEVHSHDSYTQSRMMRHQSQENGLEDDIHSGSYTSLEQGDYRDVYEVQHQSSRINHFKDQSPRKGISNEIPNEKKMALVRQKFVEAKRLSTDEKLRQSKEFQDALEVLSSNRDLFLRFLQEPSSLLSKHLHELQSVAPPPQTKRITVLKPSKTVEMNGLAGLDFGNEKQTKTQYQAPEMNQWDSNEKNKPCWSQELSHQRTESNSQHTRIVVLKPSPGKTHGTKAMVTPPTLSPRSLHGRDFCGEQEVDGLRGSREVAKEITRRMQESLSSRRGDEVTLSSVFSNGYVGDESSFNQSEIEYFEEGNLSDSEVMTPTSRHTWDYASRLGSPYSLSSFSRASYSPESSVIREAKKRLSERWAMMASNGSSQERRPIRRRSSTLGEMLGLPESKRSNRSGDGSDGSFNFKSSRSYGGEQDFLLPAACMSNERNENGVENSPVGLMRSKSLPVSSTVFEKVTPHAEFPNTPLDKAIVPKGFSKSKSMKSSFKGKVSSLLFSRNKKPSKEKTIPSPLESIQDGKQPSHVEQTRYDASSTGKGNDDSQCILDGALGEGRSLSPEVSSSGTSTSTVHGRSKPGGFPTKASLSLDKPGLSENLIENQDQPSPISVLETPFEDDANTSLSSENARLDHHRQPHLKPPVDLITCSLSWDDASLETASPQPFTPFITTSKAEEEERERFMFVQTLLYAAGLDNERCDTLILRWYSPESPLDPALLQKCFLEKKDDEDGQLEAICRQRRSNQRLLFDCINASLLEIGQFMLNPNPWSRSRGTRKRVSRGSLVAEEVWGRLREWFSESKLVSGETDSGAVVERLVNEEVIGSWSESMVSEIEHMGRRIEEEVFEQLIIEELTGFSCGRR